MQSILKALKLLADANRLRMLLLLEQEELSVAELQDVMGLGQSTISTQLSQMKQSGLVEDRRVGKNVMYRLAADSDGERIAELMGLARHGAKEIPEARRDMEALKLVLDRRKDRVRAYFDELAGKFGRHYVPGRSWKGLAEALLRLMPQVVVADLGAGEGTFSQLLAKRAARVIAVDNSEKMAEYGSRLAAEHGLENVEYRLGDLEELPIADGEVDVAFFSQSLHHADHPEKAVREAMRVMKAGGRIVVLDLQRHAFEQARELYADVWMGFSEAELVGYLRDAGFAGIETAIVHREEQSPHFQTILAVADKPV